MRILHAILSDGFYGSERYCIDLAIAQARAGHDVIVLANDGGSPCARQFRKFIAEASGDDALAGAIRLVVMPRSVPAWLQRPAAWTMLARIRPDVVHTHLNPAARRVGATAQRLGIPHVLTLHLDYDRNEHAPIDGLVALTEMQWEQIPADFAGKVATVWNWLPSTVEAALARVQASDVQRLRSFWRADDDAIVFGSVGRLMPEKGMDVLIGAFKTAFAAGENPVRLVIAGDGGQRAGLEQLAGGDGRIVLAGAQPEIATFYRAFDVFVSAARSEPFGLAIIEAMAAGCPLIATKTRGPVEFMTDPRTLWAEPGRGGELALQLRVAAARGRERFAYEMSQLTVDRAVREIEALYRGVARPAERRRA